MWLVLPHRGPLWRSIPYLGNWLVVGLGCSLSPIDRAFPGGRLSPLKDLSPEQAVRLGLEKRGSEEDLQVSTFGSSSKVYGFQG